MTHRKRSHGEYENDGANVVGVGQTLARLNGNVESRSMSPTTAVSKPAAHQQHTPANGDDGTSEWQTVERRGAKKRKKQPSKEKGNYPSIAHSANARLQSSVKIANLQDLVLYLLSDGSGPQWISVKHHASVKHVVVLMVPGLEPEMFDGKIPLSAAADSQSGHANGDSSKVQDSTYGDTRPEPQPKKLRLSPDDYYPVKLTADRLPDPLKPLSSMFEHLWPIKTPGDDKYCKMHSPLTSMLTAPIQKIKEEKTAKGPQPPAEGKSWQNRRTRITELLASSDDLAENEYVLHPAHLPDAAAAAAEAARRKAANKAEEHGWVDVPGISELSIGDVSENDIEKGSVTAGRTILAMDCEMCLTSERWEPQVFALTRISIVGWDGTVVMDELVKPEKDIKDYLTPYSGITKEMLEPITTTLKGIQAKLLTLFTPQTILIGHSLNSDLNALQITHPFIIDTSLIFPHPRGPPLKSSLKWLAQRYLSREIQKGHGTKGHDSIEDARACLDLVKQKCEKGKLWGTSEAQGESIFKRLARARRPKRDRRDPDGEEEYRIGAVVDWGEPSRGFGGAARVAIGCENDQDVVKGVKRAVLGDEDGAVVPAGGCDFVWARLRSLEAKRGWWNSSKSLDAEERLANTIVDNSGSDLATSVTNTVQHIQDIYEVLPPCTAFMVYSGSGDPRELSKMQEMQKRFKDEYKVKKWDELSVRWTDVEEQALRKACWKARMGVGFVGVK